MQSEKENYVNERWVGRRVGVAIAIDITSYGTAVGDPVCFVYVRSNTFQIALRLFVDRGRM